MHGASCYGFLCERLLLEERPTGFQLSSCAAPTMLLGVKHLETLPSALNPEPIPES